MRALKLKAPKLPTFNRIQFEEKNTKMNITSVRLASNNNLDYEVLAISYFTKQVAVKLIGV